MSTTIASMPRSRSCGTSALMVSASSANRSPAAALGLMIAGVPLSVSPMKATGTLPNVLTT